MTRHQLSITALDGMPSVTPGDDVSNLLIAALTGNAINPRKHDIIVVTQKIVSKGEGRYIDLADLEPSPRARILADVTKKDPRLVEAILSQSAEVLRAKPNVLIVATEQGLVLANAGIDQSNLDTNARGQVVLLLPEDPDASARALKEKIDAHYQTEVGVIISDSVGRAWRLGTVGLAIGAAGVPSLLDRRGEEDLAGRKLEVTEVGFADAVAAAAVLVMGEAAEGRPAAHVRGVTWTASPKPAAALIRPAREDLFR